MIPSAYAFNEERNQNLLGSFLRPLGLVGKEGLMSLKPDQS